MSKSSSVVVYTPSRIAEETASRTTDELLALLPWEAPRDKARDLIRRFRDECGGAEPDMGTSAVGSRQVWRSAQRTRLKRSLPTLDNADGTMTRTETVMLELPPWCRVLVDADKLHRMTDDQAAMLGEALIATLVDTTKSGGS